MKLISASEMRELDRRTIEEFGIPGEELMETAGQGLADAIRKLAGNHQLVDAPLLFIAGCGNNGGDAFVAARILHEDGGIDEVWLAGSENKLKGDALAHFKRMKKAGVPFSTLETSNDWKNATACGNDAEIIVDGLLGTGATGEPRGVIADAVAFIEANTDRALVVAIDIPSGMAIRADLTVTMGLPKADLVQPENIDFVGNLDVIDIGIPPEYIEATKGEADLELIHPTDLAPLFPRRGRDMHKGAYGHVLCVGGSKGFSGAITMAARAAARAGAGLVSALVPDNIYAAVAPVAPEVMVHTFPDLGKVRDVFSNAWNSIVIGPGLTRSNPARDLVLRLLNESRVPLVLDADAIAVLANHTDEISAAQCPLILTPHPGEFAMLFGLKVEDVQADRLGMAHMAAAKLNAVMVLKGAGTVVAAPGKTAAINMTGNPGMASGGSGDVLAGMVGALAGQGIGLFEAACAAVWLHGRAGDLAAAEKSQAGLIAPDLIDKIPDALREVSCR
ncbi:MAG: NAD(P)H-hydrate dehydratase [Kiritimatiellales bacterium]|nr:NAD(P)H-hydrate dehydratase [Kiritimatiellales bacterium]